jgi:hypothetical protein
MTIKTLILNHVLLSGAAISLFRLADELSVDYSSAWFAVSDMVARGELSVTKDDSMPGKPMIITPGPNYRNTDLSYNTGSS